MLWLAVCFALVAALGVAAGWYVRQLEDGELGRSLRDSAAASLQAAAVAAPFICGPSVPNASLV
jgi:hypothetical protein